MMPTRGTGLSMLWADVAADAEADFERWSGGHAKRLAALPGFLSVARYVALKGGPKHLTVCELDDTAALGTPEYAALRRDAAHWGAPGSPTRTGTGVLLKGYRRILPLRSSAADLSAGPASYLQVGRLDVPAAIEEEFNEWYNTVYVPGYLTVPGVTRARRFVALDGPPKYLVAYELERPDVPESEAWTRVRDGNPWNARIRPHMRHDPGSPMVCRRVDPA
jgi:hypothetical protein